MSRHYELVLMLDPEISEADRDKVADGVRAQIESGGALDHSDSWGMRKLAYEIRQRNEADYRFFRFQCENDLLQSLDHNLKIADGALRFRIFKVDPEAPTAPPPASGQAGPAARDDDREAPRREEPAAPTPAPAAAPEEPAAPSPPEVAPPAPAETPAE
jgi:small subunit ribosomal protein S6